MFKDFRCSRKFLGFKERNAVMIGTFLRGFGLGPTDRELKEGRLAGQPGVRCAGGSGDGQMHVF